MSTCICAVHVMYYFNTGSKFSNFTDLQTLTHATRSYTLLLQPIIAVRLFTSDMFHSCYSAASWLHTNYSFVRIPFLFTIWSLVDGR